MLLSIFYSSALESGPWLNGAREVTISSSVFSSSKFWLESYKAYVNYGITDNINVNIGSNIYKPALSDLFYSFNEIGLKGKILERHFEGFQYIISTELLTRNAITHDRKFMFVSNVVRVLAGVKLRNVFVTLEPFITINSIINYPEMHFSIGCDYSEYSTIVFAKTLSINRDESWKIFLAKNLVANLDLSLEYIHHIDNYDKFSIGLWYKVK